MIYGAIGYFGVSFIYSYNYDENFGYKVSNYKKIIYSLNKKI